jgi:hypothetical protein
MDSESEVQLNDDQVLQRLSEEEKVNAKNAKFLFYFFLFLGSAIALTYVITTLCKQTPQ